MDRHLDAVVRAGAPELRLGRPDAAGRDSEQARRAAGGRRRDGGKAGSRLDRTAGARGRRRERGERHEPRRRGRHDVPWSAGSDARGQHVRGDVRRAAGGRERGRRPAAAEGLRRLRQPAAARGAQRSARAEAAAVARPAAHQRGAAVGHREGDGPGRPARGGPDVPLVAQDQAQRGARDRPGARHRAGAGRAGRPPRSRREDRRRARARLSASGPGADPARARLRQAPAPAWRGGGAAPGPGGGGVQSPAREPALLRRRALAADRQPGGGGRQVDGRDLSRHHVRAARRPGGPRAGRSPQACPTSRARTTAARTIPASRVSWPGRASTTRWSRCRSGTPASAS